MPEPSVIPWKQIEAIYFDAGDTLVRPLSGHWYIPPSFDEILSSHSLTRPEDGILIPALESGYPFLNENHYITSEEEEADQFTKYFTIVLASLKIPDRGNTLAAEMATDMVYNDDKFVFFDDVSEHLARLDSSRIRLGILSNTWPSLERVFKGKGLYDMFDAFVVSSKVGCFKPNMKIYNDAIGQMNVDPGATLFVDDSDDNLASGRAAGFHPLKINRYTPCGDERYHCITRLSELCEMVL